MARIKKSTGVNRKSAGRNARAVGKKKAKVKPAKVVKTKISAQPSVKLAGRNRAEGIRLFKLAGRPTREQFIVVYGTAGPRMTWAQRAKAGVPAAKFQAALAAKRTGR